MPISLIASLIASWCALRACPPEELRSSGGQSQRRSEINERAHPAPGLEDFLVEDRSGIGMSPGKGQSCLTGNAEALVERVARPKDSREGPHRRRIGLREPTIGGAESDVGRQ